MKNHTPTPWHIGMRPGPMIYGTKGEQIVNMHVPMLMDDEHKANVAFIVRACNGHDELVAAIEKVARILDAQDDPRYSIHHPLVPALLKALAKARGEA